MTWQEEANKVARGIRLRVLEHTIVENGGYLCQACSSVKVMSTPYKKIPKPGKLGKPLMSGPFTGTPGKDHRVTTGVRFNGNHNPDCNSPILLPAQYALVLYATLIEAGRADESGMKEYNMDGGSVEMVGAEHPPGMGAIAGPLGQGISQAAGIVFARKQRRDQGGVAALLSDGEYQSGELWEAVQAASFHHLDNILAFIGASGHQCDNKTTTAMNIEPFEERLRSLGAYIHKIDGHDVKKIAGMGKMEVYGEFAFALCDTDPCHGLEFLRGRELKYHYIRFLNQEDRERYRGYYERLTTGES